MSVNINKTGGDNTSSCVALLGASTVEGAYGHDSPMADGDVRLKRRTTGSVINQAVTNYVIEVHTHSAPPQNVGWSKTIDIEHCWNVVVLDDDCLLANQPGSGVVYERLALQAEEYVARL